MFSKSDFFPKTFLRFHPSTTNNIFIYIKSGATPAFARLCGVTYKVAFIAN